MCYTRHGRAGQFFAEGTDLEHEIEKVILCIGLEPITHVLGQHSRSKWTVRLAEFYFFIQDGAGVVPARIEENAAMTERARPEFRAALEPADDFPFA